MQPAAPAAGRRAAARRAAAVAPPRDVRARVGQNDVYGIYGVVAAALFSIFSNARERTKPASIATRAVFAVLIVAAQYAVAMVASQQFAVLRANMVGSLE